MKRIFNDRTRLVVYLDKADVIRMESKAKAAGETLQDWARNVLRNELTIDLGQVQANPRGEDTPRESVGPRRSVTRQKATPALRTTAPASKTCPHGIEKGWRCTLCGGIVK